ncbi:MAG: hypothetical protein ACI9G1_000734 [Pirellulaceae bacterium]|jgi:hypothetical protein
MFKYDLIGTAVVRENGSKTGRLLPRFIRNNQFWGTAWGSEALSMAWRSLNPQKSVIQGSTGILAEGNTNYTLKDLVSKQLQWLMLKSEGEISISTRNKNLLTPDACNFGLFRFRSTTARLSHYEMLNFMLKAKINSMNPLVDISRAISNWASALSAGQFNFRFEFTWS